MPASPVFGKVLRCFNLPMLLRASSITDVCNFRCTYCLPDGYKPQGHSNKSFLSLDEIRRVSRAFAHLGTEKVRLTGGEPSLRRDFCEIIAAVRENPTIKTLAVTTNGYRMRSEEHTSELQSLRH